MSKGRYRSIEIKQVDWQRLSEQVIGRRVVLAIDVAKDDAVIVFMDDGGRNLPVDDTLE